MKHVKLYWPNESEKNESSIIFFNDSIPSISTFKPVKDAEKRINIYKEYYKQYRDKCSFYQHHSFLDLVSIVMIESIAYELIYKYFTPNLRELQRKKHKNITKVLNAVVKFEKDHVVKLKLFKCIDVNYLEFISAQNDRKLYLKEIHQYTKTFSNKSICSIMV